MEGVEIGSIGRGEEEAGRACGVGGERSIKPDEGAVDLHTAAFGKKPYFMATGGKVGTFT